VEGKTAKREKSFVTKCKKKKLTTLRMRGLFLSYSVEYWKQYLKKIE
jgi:hypothetical protein